MVDACVCYSCDKNYLLPTIVSSLQAREHLSPHLADVIVNVVGGFVDPRGTIAELLRANGVRLRVIDARDLDSPNIMFAWLSLDRILDVKYKRVLHIDSDTQIMRSLDPLFEVDLPPGYLMAAPDPLAVRIHEKGKFWTTAREYFRSIGIQDRNLGRYINTGLFGGARSDMASASRECQELLRRRKEPMRWFDQDSLNLVMGDNFKHLSLRWNFPSFFMNCGFETLFRPHMVHFMSNPRPWHGPFRPWGRKAYAVYIDQTTREPDLKPFLNRLTAPKYIKYNLQQRVKRFIESRTWTRPEVMMRLAELESDAIV